MDTDNKGADTPHRRAGGLLRLLRGVGWLLLILIMLLVTGYGYEVYRCSRFTPTGDALFDRYGREVTRRQAWRLFSHQDTHPATLPDSVLASWEPEFGTDPDYWELRYWCALYRDKGFLWEMGMDAYPDREEYIAALGFLDEARTREAADTSTLVLMRMSIDRVIDWYSDDDGAATAEQLDLATIDVELNQLESDYSWAHYVRARAAIRAQDYPAALEAIVAGNTCGGSHWPLCFPVEVARSQCLQLDPPNPELLGAILNTDVMYPLFWYDVRKYTPDFFDWVARRGQPAEITACHGFACRVGSAPGNTLGVRIAPYLILQVAYANLEHNAAEYTPEQLHVACAVIDRTRDFQRKTTWYHSELYTSNWMLEPYGFIDSVAVYRYSPPRPIGDYRLLKYANLYYFNLPAGLRMVTENWSNELYQYDYHAWPVFRNIALIDYATLELPREWRNIDADNGFPRYHPEYDSRLKPGG